MNTPSTCTVCGKPFENNQTAHDHGPLTIPSGLARTAPIPLKDTVPPEPILKPKEVSK
jgi:hypothetical protein